jgi:hypothetical protein
MAFSRLTVVGWWVVIGGGPAAAQGQVSTADDVARQFVSRQYEMTPVTGEFVVNGTSRQDPKRTAELAAAGWTPAPSERVLKCRWAFDRNREVLNTLDGSSGVFRRFYLGPSGLIEGDSPKSYHLEAARTVALVS